MTSCLSCWIRCCSTEKDLSRARSALSSVSSSTIAPLALSSSYLTISTSLRCFRVVAYPLDASLLLQAAPLSFYDPFDLVPGRHDFSVQFVCSILKSCVPAEKLLLFLHPFIFELIQLCNCRPKIRSQGLTCPCRGSGWIRRDC